MTIELFLAVIAGALCGFFSSIATSGATVTLPFLLFIGLTPMVANGTNRVQLFVACLVATIVYLKEGLIEWKLAFKILLPSIIGCLFGAYFAQLIPQSELKILISVATLLVLVLLLTKIKQAFMAVFEGVPRFRWQEYCGLFFVGGWIGFIAIDGFTYLLLVLILGCHLNLSRANIYKNIVGLVLTGISIVLFSVDGNIDWEIGGFMALGSIFGAYIGAKLSLWPAAKIWTYRIVLLTISLEVLFMGYQYLYPLK